MFSGFRSIKRQLAPCNSQSLSMSCKPICTVVFRLKRFFLVNLRTCIRLRPSLFITRYCKPPYVLPWLISQGKHFSLSLVMRYITSASLGSLSAVFEPLTTLTTTDKLVLASAESKIVPKLPERMSDPIMNLFSSTKGIWQSTSFCLKLTMLLPWLRAA